MAKKKRSVIPLLTGALGAAILILLGAWQLERLAEKSAVLDKIEARIQAEPEPLPEVFDAERDQYRPVKFEGVFTGETLDVLVSRKHVGAGYRIIAVVETDGRRIMVDRGFMPEILRRSLRPGRNVGPVTFYANLLWPDEVDRFTPLPQPEKGLWFARDIKVMAEHLLAEPVLAVQWSASYDDKNVEPLPVDTVGIPNNHLGYAIQWFALALVWAGMTGYFIWCSRPN